jgi:hypothetical protein
MIGTRIFTECCGNLAAALSIHLNGISFYTSILSGGKTYK